MTRSVLIMLVFLGQLSQLCVAEHQSSSTPSTDTTRGTSEDSGDAVRSIAPLTSAQEQDAVTQERKQLKEVNSLKETVEDLLNQLNQPKRRKTGESSAPIRSAEPVAPFRFETPSDH